MDCVAPGKVVSGEGRPLETREGGIRPPPLALPLGVVLQTGMVLTVMRKTVPQRESIPLTEIIRSAGTQGGSPPYPHRGGQGWTAPPLGACHCDWAFSQAAALAEQIESQGPFGLVPLCPLLRLWAWLLAAMQPGFLATWDFQGRGSEFPSRLRQLRFPGLVLGFPHGRRAQNPRIPMRAGCQAGRRPQGPRGWLGCAGGTRTHPRGTPKRNLPKPLQGKGNNCAS